MRAYENPEVPRYLYRCYDQSGELIYIGITADLFSRVKSHVETKWWGDQIHKTRAKLYPNLSSAMRAEAEAIRAENPRWNIQSKWANRHQWTPQECQDYLTALANQCGGYITAAAWKRVEEVTRLLEKTDRIEGRIPA